MGAANVNDLYSRGCLFSRESNAGQDPLPPDRLALGRGRAYHFPVAPFGFAPGSERCNVFSRIAIGKAMGRYFPNLGGTKSLRNQYTPNIMNHNNASCLAQAMAGCLPMAGHVNSGGHGLPH